MNVIINYDASDHIYIVCGKTDLRKGIDGLAEIIRSDYDYDPFSSALFLFCGSSRDRFKALYWDTDGFYLLYKRLENGVFQWPRTSKELKELSPEAFHLLLTGFSPFPSINPAKTGSIF